MEPPSNGRFHYLLIAYIRSLPFVIYSDRMEAHAASYNGRGKANQLIDRTPVSGPVDRSTKQMIGMIENATGKAAPSSILDTMRPTKGWLTAERMLWSHLQPLTPNN